MASAYTRLLRRAGRHPVFAAIGRRAVPVDRWLQHASGGRLTVLGHDALPQLLLTVTGRKTGRPRVTPLLYVRDGADWIVVASNWGQPDHPAWSANLLVEPDAVVALAGRRTDVRASLVEGAERERLWRVIVDVWPAYDDYSVRSGRELRVFRLASRTSRSVA